MAISTARARRARSVAREIVRSREVADIIVMTTPPEHLDRLIHGYVRARILHEGAARLHRRNIWYLAIAVGFNVGVAIGNLFVW